jgi:hypothetical protein
MVYRTEIETEHKMQASDLASALNISRNVMGDISET